MKYNDNELSLCKFGFPLDDHIIRALIYLEILSRSSKDFREVVKEIFERTWEFKILELLVLWGPLYKTQICEKLFPNSKDSHYKLSRSSQIFSSFRYLLDKNIVVIKSKSGRTTLYDVSDTYKPIIQALICSDIFAR
jgi:hypothetical protein